MKAIIENGKEHELSSKAQKYFDDDLFGESLDLSSNMEDNYVWSVYGQCWLPK